jgi:micrococcal nuclease
VSKHWTPRKPTVALGTSRIRRDPVRLEPVRPEKETKGRANSREREMWGGVAGVLLLSAALATLVVGVSAVTIFAYASGPEPRPGHFGQCYNENGPNCVLDGGTAYVAGERVTIAGMDAPQIQGAACAAEQIKGIEAAIQLAGLFNSGQVRKVAVNGEDVGAAMIEAGVARDYGSAEPNWCAN